MQPMAPNSRLALPLPQIFTLDPMIGEFVLTHPNQKLPERGSIYSMNEANVRALILAPTTLQPRCQPA